MTLKDFEDYIGSSHVDPARRESDWSEQQPFRELMPNVWVYSVYYIPFHRDGTPSHLRGIAISMVNKRKAPVICAIVFEDNSVSNTMGYIDNALDPHKLNYSAGFVNCPLQESYSLRSRPKYVSFLSLMTRLQSSKGGHVFPVMYPEAYHTYNMTVCYSVMFNGYNDVTSFMQNVEFNRVMGAQHFVVYEMSVSQNVTRLLQWYAARGLVTVLPMPAWPADLSWYHGQIASINDCVLRNRGRSRFVSVQDVDEYLLPLQHASWAPLLQHLDTHSDAYDFILPSDIKNGHLNNNQTNSRLPSLKGPIGAYSFQSNLYCVKREKGVLEFLKNKVRLVESDIRFIFANGVHLFLERYRFPEMVPYPRRTKTIYRPEFARQPGIHFARQLWDGAGTAVINPSLGKLGHFRQQWQKHFSCVFDSTITTYYEKYLHNLELTHKEYAISLS